MNKNNNTKAKYLNIAESIIFVITLCVMALRLSISENPHIELLAMKGGFFDNFLSITVSCLLISMFFIWFLARIWLADEKFQIGIFDIGIFIFIISTVISTAVASNKRVAITDSVTLLSAMATGAMLIRLLSSMTKRKVLLFVIISMAAANVYQCTEQFANSNKMMIDQYEKEPTVQLENLGIEPGSFQHMLYEHRLYSRDIRGFFTTSNSSATLFALAIFCAFAVFNFKADINKAELKKIFLPIAILITLGIGMALTHSKGAFAALAAAAAILIIATKFGNFLKNNRLAITIAMILLAGICLFAIIGYGRKHGSLPGGNSMLVRWQYWSSTAKMIADNPATGIGGANFGTHYTQYKIPQALETVKDPHCFALSILSQYGTVGLIGFAIMLSGPIIAVCKKTTEIKSLPDKPIIKLLQISSVSALFALLLIRPLFTRTGISTNLEVMIYIAAITYIAPAFFFCVTAWLCGRAGREKADINLAALLCGIIAVIIHNLIDFAIFEPAIMTTLLACIAVICSAKTKPAQTKTVGYSKPAKLTFTIISAAAVIFLTQTCLIPSAATSLAIEKAKVLSYQGQFDKAIEMLDTAVKADKLNPSPLAISGKLMMTKFNSNPPKQQPCLIKAEKYFAEAIKRDPADFKNYQNLADVYEILGQIKPEKRTFWFEKSLDSLSKAMEKYPGSGDLHIQTAQTAETLGNIDTAIKHYAKAVEIENAYAEQFKAMYPGKEVFSRLGKIKYKLAQEKLEELPKMNDN